MRAFRRQRLALTLLLAAFGQPAWALAHAAVHEHLAQHHAEAAPHPPASGLHADATVPEASPARAHDHDHLAAVFLRPTHSTDSPAPVALPSTMTCLAAARPCPAHREPPPSGSSPEASGPSDPRAPPIA